MPRVSVFHAAGCHLCERALAKVRALLERGRSWGYQPERDVLAKQRHREWLPVVEIDGERAFVYYVDPTALRRKIAAQS